ncbi:DUF3037 domain-containing protein [Paraflavisolibacter sp. H34]|uniref:DUF3037 domain-containing protein n=1 Tax=Huijunlia imazamoxiresistens TaxID=3127457 RepID=UPI00301A3824
MQENHLFEYAVIRVVPRVEREEFLNVGVVLFSKKQKYLNVLFQVDHQRLQCFAGGLDTEEVEKHLHAFEQICKGSAGSGPIGKLDPASRFRWLTATRSTVVQTSRVHPGFCTDVQQALERLFSQLVLL